jgi:hypothetical protein
MRNLRKKLEKNAFLTNYAMRNLRTKTRKKSEVEMELKKLSP